MSCIFQTPQQELDQAEVIVTGIVTDIQTAPRSTKVTVDVDKVLKGTAADPLTIITDYGSNLSTSVDFVFTKGATYKIYLYTDETGKLATNECTGTTLLTAAKTEASNPDITTTVGSSNLLWAIGIGVVAIVICVSVIIFKRRSK